MNTTKESPLGTNKETSRNPLDVRIILAVLWVAGMLSSLMGDAYRLADPVAQKASLANTASFVAPPELVLVFSLIFAGSVFMSVLTLTLKSPASRWANRIVGIIFAIIPLAFWVLHLFVWRSAGYEIVWATAQLVFALLVVWYAWKWRNPEGRF
jgi:hypothetical protein